MEQLAAGLSRTVSEAAARLRALGEDAARAPWADGKWTRAQVLGHLIDSALNNYHRVIRAQAGSELVFPDYQQEHWVAAGAYAGRAWTELVTLWEALNGQLAHAIAHIRPEALPRPCRIGAGAPVTLEFIVRDYPRHLEHHLRQVLDGGGGARTVTTP
jgi:hypothetical protein